MTDWDEFLGDVTILHRGGPITLFLPCDYNFDLRYRDLVDITFREPGFWVEFDRNRLRTVGLDDEAAVGTFSFVHI